MFGPPSVKDIMMLATNPLYPSHVDTNYQIYGGYMNAAPAVPAQPYEGMDMHLDPYQGSMDAQEQFLPTPEPDFQEFEEDMAQMAQMEDIGYDPVGMNEFFIDQATDDFFGPDTLEDMLDDPEFDVQRMRQMFFDSF